MLEDLRHFDSCIDQHIGVTSPNLHLGNSKMTDIILKGNTHMDKYYNMNICCMSRSFQGGSSAQTSNEPTRCHHPS